jgi:hypothetical protein
VILVAQEPDEKEIKEQQSSKLRQWTILPPQFSSRPLASREKQYAILDK